MHRDQRDESRLPISLFVNVISGGGGAGGEAGAHACLSQDLGPNGMSVVQLPQGPPLGSPRYVWLHFQLPDREGTTIRALGELRHEDDSRPLASRGFWFKYINPRSRRRYDAFLADRLTTEELPALAS